MKAIVVNSLSKQFKIKNLDKDMKSAIRKGASGKSEFLAVNNIRFNVEKGEIFGLLGPNGAGKSTTIRMLTGVIKPTKGQTEIFGKNLWLNKKNSILVKQILGNVPEMANLYPELTGIQNLTLIGELYDIPKKIRLKRAEELLKKFDLFEKRNFKAKTYSKGMKQRILICMALMNNPKILFLDEPTSGLDVISARIIKQLIKEHNKNGVTILLTTHDMAVANELCDRIAVINKGKILCIDTPRNLKELYKEKKKIYLLLDSDVDNQELKNLNSIDDLTNGKSGLTLTVKDYDLALVEILDYVRVNKLRIKVLKTLQPTLEDIFVKIIERGGSY